MAVVYEPEFKKKIVRLHFEEGRTYKSISSEYGVSKSAISNWCSEFSSECHNLTAANPNTINEVDVMKENLRLRKELEETKKENLFLKESKINKLIRHSLQMKSISGLSIYRKISQIVWSTLVTPQAQHRA